MKTKKILCVLASVIMFAVSLIVSSFSVFSDNNELNYELGKVFTAQNNADTYFFDENFGSDIAVNAMKLIVSVTVVDFDANGGFGLKFIINNNSSSDDFYFLTMNTNQWAYNQTKNPIETEKKGTYTLEFDLSQLGQVASIQGVLWQGSVELNGLKLLDKNNNELMSFGNIIEPTVGYYKAGVGKVVQKTTAETTAAQTTSVSEISSQTSSVATSIMTNKSSSGFSFWWIAIPTLAAGIILIALAIIFTKKMK